MAKKTREANEIGNADDIIAADDSGDETAKL